MAALSHTKRNEAVASFDDVADALAKMSEALMSQEVGSRRIEEAFMKRLLQVLALAPHDVHDLAVSGKLDSLMPSNEDYDDATQAPAFTDLPSRRPGGSQGF